MDTPLSHDSGSAAAYPPEVAVVEIVGCAPAAATTGVLHLINGEHYAGAERVQDLLAQCLPEYGYQVGFACMKLDLFDEMRESHVPLYRVPMWSRFDIRAAWKVANLVRKGQYQLLHAHTVRTALIGAIAARLTHVPLVYHAHSPTSNDTTRPWRNNFNGLIERRSLRGVSHVIAVSHAIADHIIAEGFDVERVTVVHNGVPCPQVLPERAAPTGTWTLGVTALFRPRKGLEVLLEALAMLRARNLPVHLRAVGMFESSAYEAAIVAQVRRLGLCEHITWTGFTRNPTAELAHMDLFVLPSLFGEGLPMVVLEAMAAGVPVVATHVTGVPEAIRNGQDGILVPPGDPTALADAIARFVRGDISWTTVRNHELAQHARHFSARQMAAGVAAVYRKVLEPTSPDAS